jgi:hypothetical protein
MNARINSLIWDEIVAAMAQAGLLAAVLRSGTKEMISALRKNICRCWSAGNLLHRVDVGCDNEVCLTPAQLLFIDVCAEETK